MVLQHLAYKLNPLQCRHIRKAKKSAVGRAFSENEGSEILVHGCFRYIMSLLTKPLCKQMAHASVNKELHLPATPTESRESLVITAWA